MDRSKYFETRKNRKIMLKVNDKERATGPLDRQVKLLVQQICYMWDEMEDFERLFAQRVSEMKKVNHINPVFAYRMVKINDKIEVWHINNETSMPDRMMCEVEHKPDNSLE